MVMKWLEVREMHPNKFIKFEVLDFHVVDNKRYVDELSVIKVISDNIEAMKEFSECKEGQFVYSTKNDELVIDVIKHIGIRRSM